MGPLAKPPMRVLARRASWRGAGRALTSGKQPSSSSGVQHSESRRGLQWKAHLDYKRIREERDETVENVRKRQSTADVDSVISLYNRWLSEHAEADRLRAQRNETAQRLSDDIDDSERARLKEEGKQLKEQIALLEQQLEQTQAELQNEALQIPNDTHPDVPVGDEDSSAAVLSEFGSQPSFPFTPKDHTELSDTVGLADFDAGSRVSGTKFVYLQGYGAMLEMALINFAFTRAVQRGFAPYMTPDMVRRQVVEKCGFNPRGDSSQVYNIEDHDLSMAGTAEIPLGGLHEDRIINESQLPLRMVAFGHCFRTESGASGAATRGLYRLHQFSKVELFVICTPEQSEQMHEELLKLEEDLFRNLDLHFRTIDMPTGDLGAPAYRKYDIEASMPGMGRYGEISSATNCTDFQSRRLNTRFRRQPSPGKKKGKPEYVHTLNATALAVPRTIIAIAEQKQNADGSINVPEVLQPYMGGVRVLQPPTEQGSGNRGSIKHEEETVRA